MKQKYNEQSEHDPCHRLTSSSQNDKMIFFVLRGLYYGEPWWGRLYGWKCCFLVLRGWRVGWGHAIIHDDKFSPGFFLSPIQTCSHNHNHKLLFIIIRLCPTLTPVYIYPLIHFRKIDMNTKTFGGFIRFSSHCSGGWCLGGHPRFRSLHPSQRKSACS